MTTRDVGLVHSVESINNRAFDCVSTDEPSRAVPAGHRLTHGEAPRDSAPAVPGVRASDSERERVVALLHQAMSEGRLDFDETVERVMAAYAARYRSEFAALLADLPAGGIDGVVSAPAGGWAGVWTGIVEHLLRTSAGGAGSSPTGRERRMVAGTLVLALMWTLTCAVIGALAVAL